MQNVIQVFQAKALEWDINLSEAAVFDYLWNATSWAEPVIIAGSPYYWVSRTAAAKDLLLLSKSARLKIKAGKELDAKDADTFYRHYKSLEKKGLIRLEKLGNKDCFQLTEKSKSWTTYQVGKISEQSEKNPTYKLYTSNNSNSIVGKISEQSETPVKLEGLPPQEQKIEVALHKCKEFFENWPAMKVNYLEGAKIRPGQIDFDQELRKWISHNSLNVMFMQSPTNHITKSFQSWLINAGRYAKKSGIDNSEPSFAAPKKSYSRKNGRKREDVSPDVNQLASKLRSKR